MSILVWVHKTWFSVISYFPKNPLTLTDLLSSILTKSAVFMHAPGYALYSMHYCKQDTQHVIRPAVHATTVIIHKTQVAKL